MRIVILLPGTGSYYSGRCLRDEALAKTWHKFGHDVNLVPLYLPMVGEQPDVQTRSPLFFNGLTLHLQEYYPLFRHTPRWMDRWMESRFVAQYATRRAASTARQELGPITASVLRGEQGHHFKELQRLMAWLRREPTPDLIVLSSSLLFGLAPVLRQQFRAKLMVLVQGEYAFVDALPDPWRETVWQLINQQSHFADLIVAPSAFCADRMAERIGIPRSRIEVVHNGILLENYPYSYSPTSPPVIGFLARMSPEKGLDLLVEAFILLKRREGLEHIKLRIAGTTTRADRPYVAGLRHRIMHEGMSEDVEFLPNPGLAEKRQFLNGLTAMSVPAVHGEAFGLYLLEALASGVPVVQPRDGAFPELLAATGGGLLCEPRDPEALATALASLLTNVERARAFGKAGREKVLRQFSVERMAGELLYHVEQAKRLK